MSFTFGSRPSDSPLVETIWHTESEGSGSFISRAESHWEMVVTRQGKRTTLTVRGPETRARLAPIPDDAEFMGIVFKLGTFMPHLPGTDLVDCETNLPGTAGKSFWLHGSTWQFPDFENVDTFIARLVREGLVVRDPLVETVLQGLPHDLSIRTVRRRFLRATGLTPGAVRQIARAQHAVQLLQDGVSILDTVYDAGFYDQPHLTRALKQLMGQTPAQVVGERQNVPFVQDASPILTYDRSYSR